MNACVFCRIVHGQAPARIVYQDEDVTAFHDLNPQAPVHVLVIPKKRIANFEELSDWGSVQTGRFILGMIKVIQLLGLPSNGYRVVFNSGKHGQQAVAYVHAHILGGRQMAWPPG